jgi:hypothetical protein
MGTSMDLHMDAHRPIPIRRPGAEPPTDVIESSGLTWGSARPRELDGVGITPNAITRAIEDLQRSGYRPLHAAPGRAGALVDPAGARRPRRDV